MSVGKLTSRAIIGEYYKRVRALDGMGWANMISNQFTSDQDVEEYVFLGMPPAMREWVGGREAAGFRDNAFEIRNKHYEATVEIPTRFLRRDKSEQARVRIRELATRGITHWNKLLSDLIVNGASTTCYDGQFFFDTDHSEGSSGSQSNDIQVDISELPVQVNGSTTAPSPEEMQQAIHKAVTQIYSFVDDQGEPYNEDAMNFMVMVPPSLLIPTTNGLRMPRDSGVSAQIPGAEFNITPVANSRLASSWTEQFAVFRTDGDVKPLIRQTETENELKAKAEGSEFEFDNDAHQYGVDAWRNVGYGMWQEACLVTLI